MTLNDLLKNQRVNIDIVRDNAVFEVNTVVVGTVTDEHGIERVLLEPFVFKGKVMDLEKEQKKDVVYNIYAMDEHKQRICWKNASVQIQNYSDKVYYAIAAKGFKTIGVEAERRIDQRLSVDTPAVLKLPGGKNQNIVLKNISNSGLAFYGRPDMDIVNRPIVITFNEEIEGQPYELEIIARCVREQKFFRQSVYGCRVAQASNEMLTYIYVRRIFDKRHEIEKSIQNAPKQKNYFHG